jgi:peptidoglycan L-alanyl-D-glutamate endopeptidase CwlK
MKLQDMIAAVQAELGVQVDGKAGPETWTAIHKALVRAKPPKRGAHSLEITTVDPRSEKVIGTLLPEVRPLARALVHRAAEGGVRIKIISGHRSYEEQDALYARGRTLPGNKITNARGGYSNHNFGLAFDVGVFEGNQYLGDSPKYKAVGVLGMDLGLEWGGSWKSIVDQPHFQLRPGWACDLPERQMLAQLRERVSSGESLFA